MIKKNKLKTVFNEKLEYKILVLSLLFSLINIVGVVFLSKSIYYILYLFLLYLTIVIWVTDKEIQTIHDSGNNQHISIKYLRFGLTLFKVGLIICHLFSIPILIDLVTSFLVEIGLSKLGTLKYVSKIELKSIEMSEYVYYIITIISSLSMGCFAYLSYKINQQQFQILKKLNDTSPVLGIENDEVRFEIELSFDQIKEVLQEEFLDMTINDAYKSLENDSIIVYKPKGIKMIKIKAVTNFYLYCKTENKVVFVNEITEKKSGLMSLFWSASEINYKIDNTNHKYTIINSEKITKYELEITKNEYTDDYRKEFCGVDVAFSTEYERIHKGIFFEREKIYDEINMKIIDILGRAKEIQKKESYLLRRSYSDVKSIFEHNSGKTIKFSLLDNTIREIRLKKIDGKVDYSRRSGNRNRDYFSKNF